MLKNLLFINNLAELEEAIIKNDFHSMVIRTTNISVLIDDGLKIDDYFLGETSDISSNETKLSVVSQSVAKFETLDDEKFTEDITENENTQFNFDEIEEKPAFLRKRRSTSENLEKINKNDPPEIKAFTEVIAKSKILNSLNNEEKNKLIETFREKLKDEIKIKNQFYATLSRPGARSKLRNIIDRYIRSSNDENIKSISKLKKRIVEDGYLVIENSSDKQGNVRFKESEKLKGVFGKDLKNNSITDQSLNETIRRSLNETSVNTLNIGI